MAASGGNGGDQYDGWQEPATWEGQRDQGGLKNLVELHQVHASQVTTLQQLQRQLSDELSYVQQLLEVAVAQRDLLLGLLMDRGLADDAEAADDETDNSEGASVSDDAESLDLNEVEWCSEDSGVDEPYLPPGLEEDAVS